MAHTAAGVKKTRWMYNNAKHAIKIMALVYIFPSPVEDLPVCWKYWFILFFNST
jgi:hypothetical protein